MKYRHIDDLLGDYLDSDLTPKENAEVEKMLSESEDLRERLAQIKNLKKTLQRISVVDPGSDYFDDLTDRIMARTKSSAALTTKPESAGRERSGRDILKVLIRLAAAITLLFASFYLTTLRNETAPVKWTEEGQAGAYIMPDSVERAFEADEENKDEEESLNKNETLEQEIR